MTRTLRRMTALLVVALVATACTNDGDEAVSADAPSSTTSPTTSVGSSPRESDDTALPIGDADSPYRVAHHLPEGYALIDVRVSESPPFGDPGTPTFGTGYGLYEDSRFDTDLSVTSFEWDAPEDFWEGAVTEAGMDDTFRLVTIRGQEGFEYPLYGDGRVYGTTLVWEDRPGLWVKLDAAEPLTRDDAYAAAEGLEPFPADQWDLLVTSVDSLWLEPGTEAAQTVPVADASDLYGWRLDALVPPRWGELSIDRRWPCARLTGDGASQSEPACNYPGWHRADGRTYLVGLAPMGVTTVTVRAGDAAVEAGTYWVDVTPDLQYWVADLTDIGCAEFQVEFDPPDLPHPLARTMASNGGPDEGC